MESSVNGRLKPEVFCAEFVPIFRLLYSVNLGRFEGGIVGV